MIKSAATWGGLEKGRKFKNLKRQIVGLDWQKFKTWGPKSQVGPYGSKLRIIWFLSSEKLIGR
jgi:hypothetical protein